MITITDSKVQRRVIKASEVVGGGYNDFWNCKKPYRVCKGSRASKKSKTTALNFIKRLMEYPDANLLVVRKTFSTLKDSCYKELKWAINRWGVADKWHCTESPLEITYKPTGQKIYFRGLDDPLKITSITVEIGVLCWLWLEEAYEIDSEDDFDTLDESIRGAMPDGLFKQATLTFNPWNEHHWLKKRFFDNPDPDLVFSKTTNYKCNEWLDEADLAKFENMRVRNPRRYRVAGLGDWGVLDGLVYENWHEEKFDIAAVKKIKGIKPLFGLDFGFTNPTAMFCGMLDQEGGKIYVFDEIYQSGMTNEDRANEIIKRGYQKENITGDAASPEAIMELNRKHHLRITPAKKGKDSVSNGIEWIQNFQIIVSPKCEGFLTEIGNYKWKKDKFGKTLDEPVKEQDHLMDAMRYACEKYIVGDSWMY